MNTEDKYMDNLLSDPENWMGYKLIRAKFEEEQVFFFIYFSQEDLIDDEIYYVLGFNKEVVSRINQLNISDKFKAELNIMEEEENLHNILLIGSKYNSIKISNLQLDILDEELSMIDSYTPSGLLEDYYLLI